MRCFHVRLFSFNLHNVPDALLLCLFALHGLQCAGLVRRDGLLLHRAAEALRKAGIPERACLSDLRPWGAGGFALSQRRLPESCFDLFLGSGSDLYCGIYHQLLYGKALSYALVGLFPLQVPPQWTGLSFELHPLWPRQRLSLSRGQPSGCGVAGGYVCYWARCSAGGNSRCRLCGGYCSLRPQRRPDWRPAGKAPRGL